MRFSPLGRWLWRVKDGLMKAKMSQKRAKNGGLMGTYQFRIQDATSFIAIFQQIKRFKLLAKNSNILNFVRSFEILDHFSFFFLAHSIHPSLLTLRGNKQSHWMPFLLLFQIATLILRFSSGLYLNMHSTDLLAQTSTVDCSLRRLDKSRVDFC